MSNSSDFTPRKPDWILKAKYGVQQGRVGAGWNNPTKGHITIQLNPFITLQAAEGLVVTLFPNKPNEEESK